MLGLSLGLGVLVRFSHLATIRTQIFDEVYFPVMANALLHGQLLFDVHPPLGKMLMALGIAAFGNNALGWRIVPAIGGVLLIALAAYTAWRNFSEEENPIVATIAMVVLVGLDGAFIVYSRTGLMDGVLVLFTLAAYCLALKATRRTIVAAAIVLGLAVSVKWVAAAVIVPMIYLLWRQKKLVDGVIYLPLAIASYLGVVLLGEGIGRVANPVQAALNWHSQALMYHLTLKATHPWSSKWWSWPFEFKPTLMYYQATTDHRIQVITSLGNPIAWWASTIAVLAAVVVVVCMVYKRQKSVLDHPLVPLLIGYFAAWIPFMTIQRVLFQYHFLTSYMFALLILAYFLQRMWKHNAAGVVIILTTVIASAIFFLPFAIASPLTLEQIDQRVWVTSWLYTCAPEDSNDHALQGITQTLQQCIEWPKAK